MKKYIISGLLITILAIPVVIKAQDSELPDPGWTPDSPFYFLEMIAERVVTFFTFGDLKKAQRHTALAAERFAETQAVAEKGKTELIEKSLKRYEDHLIKAQLRIEKAKEKGEKTDEVANIVQEAAQKHLVALEKALENAPEEAKPAIRHAMIVSTKEGREMMAEVSKDVSDEGRLRAFCLEQGAPKEMCEKIPLEGFKSFESLSTFCVEAGGPPDMCPTIEDKCKEFGVTTANECFRALSSTQVRTVPASERAMEQTRAQAESGYTYENLRSKCMEAGGAPEECEEISGRRFDSFEAIEAFCLESDGQPDMCALLEDRCKKAGATTPDQCYLFLTVSSLEAFSSVELETVPVPETELPESAPEPPVTETEKTLKQRYIPGVSEVIIYFSPTCPYCIKAKAWMDERNIKYEAIDVSELKAAGQELTTRTGGAGVPTLVMDGAVLIGFTEERYSEFFGME